MEKVGKQKIRDGEDKRWTKTEEKLQVCDKEGKSPNNVLFQ